MASSLVKNRMPNDLDSLSFSDFNNHRTLELARQLSRMNMSTDQEVYQICERSSTQNNFMKFSSTNEPITGDNFIFNSDFSDVTPPSMISTATASFPEESIRDYSSATSSSVYLRSPIKPPSSLYTGSTTQLYSGLSNDYLFGQRQQSSSLLSSEQSQPQQQQLTNMERFQYALSSTTSSSSQSPLMLEETKLRKSQNMTECVPVPSSEHVAEIVGRQGCKVKSLRTKTNTYIKTPVRGEEPVFVVTGRKEDVAKAKKEILSAAEHFSQIRASRKNLSGLGATELSGAMANLLGISGGANGSATSGVATSGNVTVNVRVPYRVVGLVVGPKGATIKRIQQQSHTYIVTPSRDKEPIFEVTGLPENVETARKEIESHIAVRTNNGTVINPSDEKVPQSNAAVSNVTATAPIAKPVSSVLIPDQLTESLFNTSLAARKMFAAGVQAGTVAAVAAAAKSQRNTTPPPPPLTSMQESPYWSIWPALKTINKKSSSENLSSTSDHSTSGNFSSNSSTNGGHTTSSSRNSFNHSSSKSVDLISFSDRCHDLSNIWSMPKPDTEPIGTRMSLLQNIISNGSAFGVGDADTSLKLSNSSAQNYDNFPFRPVNFLSSPSSSSLSPTSYSRTPSPPSDTNAIATTGLGLNISAATTAPEYSSYDNTLSPASTSTTKTEIVQSMRANSSPNKCSICFESPVQAAFVPCGHNHFCYKCAVNVCTGPSPICPCCQVAAKNVLRIYT